MTVKQLIRELNKYPKEANIEVPILEGISTHEPELQEIYFDKKNNIVIIF